MRKIILRDEQSVHDNLLPLSYTRPVADLLIGINTIRQKWEMYLPGDYHYQTEEYLGEKFPCPPSEPGDIIIASNVIPTEDLAAAVDRLLPGEKLIARNMKGEEVTVAQHLSANPVGGDILFQDKIDTVDFLYDIFLLNPRQIEEDFQYITRGREGQSIPRSNTVIGDPDLIYIESDQSWREWC